MQIIVQTRNALARLGLHARGLTLDNRWITVKPNGPDHKGKHVEIDENGRIVKGMGGKFQGEKIGEVRKGFAGPKSPTAEQSKAIAESRRTDTEKPKQIAGGNELSPQERQQAGAFSASHKEKIDALIKKIAGDNPYYPAQYSEISKKGFKQTMTNMGLEQPEARSAARAYLAERMAAHNEEATKRQEQKAAEAKRQAEEYAKTPEAIAKKKAYEQHVMGKAAEYLNDAEKAEIDFYARSGDRRNIHDEGARQTINAIERACKDYGIEIEHVSESDYGKSKSLYLKVGDELVRVSDHELPMTAQREYNHSRGLTGRWNREVLTDDWKNTSMQEFMDAIKGVEDDGVPDTPSFAPPAGHHTLNSPLKIERETEKAYGVSNPHYEEALRVLGHGGSRSDRYVALHTEASPQAREAYENRKSLLWVPKSVAGVHEGHIHSMSDWFAKKEGHTTKEGEARREEAFAAGKQKYADLIAKAKAAGAKGIRTGMKTSTILQRLADAGIKL